MDIQKLLGPRTILCYWVLIARPKFLHRSFGTEVNRTPSVGLSGRAQVRAALVERSQAAAAEIAAGTPGGPQWGTAQWLPLPEDTAELAAELQALTASCDSMRALQVTSSINIKSLFLDPWYTRSVFHDLCAQS